MNLKSYMCKLYSAEPLSYSTVKRGQLSIYTSHVCLLSAVQPGALVELLKTDPDGQGFYTRNVLLTGGPDLSR